MKLRGGLIAAISLLLLILAVPALAALPGVKTDGSGVAEIIAVWEENCQLNVSVAVSQAGTYIIQMLDDGPQGVSQSIPTAGAGVITATYPITAPPGDQVAGVAFLVWSTNPLRLRSAVDLIVYNTGATCRAIIVDAQCSATAVIPRGAVVADLPLGGRAYWAPGKITPDVNLNPGTYWVTKVYVDPTGVSWNQIILACQYLWVPSEWMSNTATFDGPWSGEPLPSTVDSID